MPVLKKTEKNKTPVKEQEDSERDSEIFQGLDADMIQFLKETVAKDKWKARAKVLRKVAEKRAS